MILQLIQMYSFYSLYTMTDCSTCMMAVQHTIPYSYVPYRTEAMAEEGLFMIQSITAYSCQPPEGHNHHAVFMGMGGDRWYGLSATVVNRYFPYDTVNTTYTLTPRRPLVSFILRPSHPSPAPPLLLPILNGLLSLLLVAPIHVCYSPPPMILLCGD